MSTEASKTKKIWTDAERHVLTGSGIDIGCGPDPIFPDVRRFDLEDGDANVISRHVAQTFDFVFSSHCLEHMHQPRGAILEWWKLVKPGGVLFFLVPDEDLYEQGIFPSRFNPDHKATFTISKRKSWSPVSHNILDLVASLPDGELISVQQQDVNYDRSRLVFGPQPVMSLGKRALYSAYIRQRHHTGMRSDALERRFANGQPIDQTLMPDRLAQIQTIVRKRLPARAPGP